MSWLVLAIARAIRLGFAPWLVALVLLLALLFDWLVLLIAYRHMF